MKDFVKSGRMQKMNNLNGIFDKYLYKKLTPTTLKQVQSDLKSAGSDAIVYIDKTNLSQINVMYPPVKPHELPDSVISIQKDSSKYDYMKKSFIELYGYKKGTFITNRLAKAVRGKDCIDNFRLAHVDNAEELKAYKEAYDEGCCGFYDDIIVFTHKACGIPIYSEKIQIGFNYGH